MWQTVTAWATAGEQNSKWWLTPTKYTMSFSEYLKGVLGGRCNHDWGMTERGEQNKLTRHDEHLLERRNECGSGSYKGRRKNTTWKVEIFFRLLVLPLWVCFCEQSGGMTKTALPIRFKPAWAGLLLRIMLKYGLVYRCLTISDWKTYYYCKWDCKYYLTNNISTLLILYFKMQSWSFVPPAT